MLRTHLKVTHVLRQAAAPQLWTTPWREAALWSSSSRRSCSRQGWRYLHWPFPQPEFGIDCNKVRRFMSNRAAKNFGFWRFGGSKNCITEMCNGFPPSSKRWWCIISSLSVRPPHKLSQGDRDWKKTMTCPNAARIDTWRNEQGEADHSRQCVYTTWFDHCSFTSL